MRKVMICGKTAEAEDGHLRKYCYYITADELSDESGEIEVEAYGVGVSSGEKESNARALTMSASKAEHLADTLARNLVTPSTLLDIVEDLLAA